MLFRLMIYFFCLAFINLSASDRNEYQNLDRLARTIAKDALLKHGYWSVYAAYSDNGQVIVELNSQKSLAPASNLKLVTSAAALALIGENKTFDTRLIYTGSINPNGTLRGDLIIQGQGDPTLGSPETEDVPSLDEVTTAWVTAAQRAGINKIDGHIIADDSYLDYMPLPPDWFWRDIGNYYAANTSGLCINENLYYLYFEPSQQVGGPAKVLGTEPEIPGLTFINHMRTGPVGSGDNGYIYGAPWQYVHQLEGTIPAGVKEFSIKGSLPDPARFAAGYLYKALTGNGIKVTGNSLTLSESGLPSVEGTALHSISSPPLKDIIYRLNKRSINLYAEQLLKNIGKEVKNKGTYADAIEIVEEWLDSKRIYKDGLHIHDGSGLSRANMATTRFFVELLNVIYGEPYFKTFYNSLGIAGDPDDNSYMKHMCRGTLAEKNLRAKTGSINRIRAHSGYVYTRSGRLVSFSMIANEYSGRMRQIDRLHEKLMIKLAELP